VLILGIDPGLAHCGWAQLDSRDSRCRAAGHVATSKGDATGDTQRRLLEFVEALRGPVSNSDLVVIEWSSVSGAGFQRQGDGSAHGNARAAMLNAASAAAAIGIAAAYGKQVLTPAPITWRSRLGFRGDTELHQRLERLYPKTADRFNRGRRPHVLDAIGLALFGRSHATNLFTHNHATETTTP